MDIKDNRLSDPIEYVLNCYDLGLTPTRFDILNAKHQFQKINEQTAYLFNIVAWARVNNRGDLYDLRLNRNPHIDETIMLPLYANQEEFKKVAKRLKNAVDNTDE